MVNSIVATYRPQVVNLNSPLGFACPRPRIKQKLGGDKNQIQDVVEILHIWVVPGNNFFNVQEQWEPLMSHPTTKSVIDSLIRRGGILVKKPEIAEGSVLSNTTLDFSDLQDVKDLVYNSNDAEWLRRCVVKDNRPTVDKWCYERIEEIDKLKKRLTQAA